MLFIFLRKEITKKSRLNPDEIFYFKTCQCVFIFKVTLTRLYNYAL